MTDADKAHYEQLRESRRYLPSWEALSEVARNRVSVLRRKTAAMENNMCGEIYYLDKAQLSK